MKNYNKSIGNMGEMLAANYLTKRGYKILDRNFRCKHGEIDLIGKDTNVISFIEVKSRYTTSYGLPREAVNFIKKKHIYSTAKYYIYKKKLFDYNFRFDVVEIALDFNNNHYINLIKDAF